MQKKVIVNDKMQRGYTYILTEHIGKNFNAEFKPELTPKQMLELGVFGGVYMRDCKREFPSNWFTKAKFAPEYIKNHLPELNYFKVNASQSLKVWMEKGWINSEDPRGWFQWYCRYYMGRRILEEDYRQIKRWKLMKRHIAQINKNCNKNDILCRKKQRQALLHWAYNSIKI